MSPHLIFISGYSQSLVNTVFDEFSTRCTRIFQNRKPALYEYFYKQLTLIKCH
nr:MAG TPA_asm: hypothetical protein [Bacteriophage sp.]